MRQLQLPMRVWDAPIRLFHWSIVVLVFTSWLTQEMEWMQLHMWSGYAILSLLLFRLLWGVVGSDTARFGYFLKSPLAGFRHLSRIGRREPDTEIGHNAAGGWMVLIMLAALLVQAVTGLFANDDVNVEGPLYPLVNKANSDWLTHIHHLNFTIIEIVIVVHVLAIGAYAAFKGQNLLRPMVTGKKRLPGATRAPRMVHPLLALAILIVAAGIVAVIVRWGGA